MTNDLEYRMIEQLKSGQCSLERALLVVSGLDERGIVYYQRKLDQIQRDFEQWHGQRKEEKNSSYNTAKGLFDYLWETKPERGNEFLEDFLLAEVIDNQLGVEKEKVGNCVGLTSLYNVLGLRLGLKMAVFVTNDHINSLLSYGEREIMIENTSKHGFDLTELQIRDAEERYHFLFQKRGSIVLVSHALNNRGIVKNELGAFAEALQDYDKALELESARAALFNNKGAVKSDFGNFKEAILYYNKAIKLKPDYTEAFYNRGNAKYNLGDLEGAIQDYNKAIELEPDFETAIHNRKIIIKELQQTAGYTLP